MDSPIVSDSELVAKYPTKEALLAAVCKGLCPEEDALKLLSLWESQQQGELTMKVGKSGGISIYNLQRNPVTLYVAQWERVLANADKLRKFIADNLGKTHEGVDKQTGLKWKVVLQRAKHPKQEEAKAA